MRSKISSAALLVIAMNGGVQAQIKPAVYASPAEVLDAYRAANARGDVPAMLDCFSPAGEMAMTTFLMYMIGGTSTTQPADKPVDPEKVAFEKRHGLDRRERKPGESTKDFATRLAQELPDRHAFLLDFMTRQKAYASTRPASTRPTSQLEDVVIDPSGNAATGKLRRRDGDGSTISTDVKFDKIDNSWRLSSIVFL